jgi:glucose-6-phosphate isomerase
LAPTSTKIAPLRTSNPANLDALEFYSSVDPSRLGERLRRFPAQCREAWSRVLAFDLPQEHARVNKVIIAGMGGSSIGGELVADLVSQELKLPLMVCRDYYSNRKGRHRSKSRN